ncbi:oxidoreductase [Wenjunlia vitaminophila]|uniref:Oxidoreductase n=1 Tax=Wenjunlia vitaminophila TaxID=76728 RepID=A0A0T6LP09_WENVI|nr:Gfo/Idh/MocA family oxidoreductase [Wenjunlia vitaminophila]KRV47835.1 oxidoreductase [Wenjunlia vitaminophila]
MPSPFRTLFVGVGHIARAVHMPAFRQLGDDFEVVGAVDVEPAAAKAFAEEFDLPHHSTDLEAALAATRPDLVVIASPPFAHRRQTVTALRAGAWVWCEKPPALSLAEYDAMTGAEGPGGPYAPIVFQQRFGSGAEHARDLIASGEFGPPLVAHCQTTWYRDDGYYSAPWRGRWETEGGGPTLNLGIHQTDLLLELLGPWVEVRAMAGRLARPIATEDVSTALVRFASGALATVVNSALSPREVSHLRIDLRDVTIELDHVYGYANADWRYTPARGVDASRIPVPRDDVPSSHLAQLRSLLADLRAGRRPRASGADGRRSLEFVTALYKAALTGRSVRAGEIVPGDPFYAALHGGVPGWAS